MTALSEYDRLEAVGLWRADPEAQRREVIVSLGDASLVISETKAGAALAHWSLPAMIRRNPGAYPAIYAPSEEPGESLELEDEVMIAAIEKVHVIIESHRPHPGRLRSFLIGGVVLCVGAAALFWLPGALVDHAARITPMAKRIEIGRKLLAELSTMTGQPCASPPGEQALAVLSKRLPGHDIIVVLPEALKGARLLPGKLAVIGRNTIEGPDTPEVVAGYLISTEDGAAGQSPLKQMLGALGPAAALRLLTTGNLPDSGITSYAEQLLREQPMPPATDGLLRAFRTAGVSSTPYAYALDPTGETVLGLIEADPFKGEPSPRPVLPDAQWVALQDICTGR